MSIQPLNPAVPSRLELEPDSPVIAPNRPPPGEVPFGYYWLLIRRYAWRIVTFAVVTTTIVALYSLSLPKLYEAVAVVRVDENGNPALDEDARTPSAADPNMLVDTEQQVITGSAVISKAIDALHLDQVAEFTNRIPATASGDVQRSLLIREVSSHVTISRPLNTLLLEIHFRSQSPGLAARAANGIAQAFLEQEYATRAQALTDASRSMSQELDGLRARMEQDQQALVNYESSSNVVAPDSNSNIVEASLSQTNQDLGKAESDRIRLQAENDLARSADPNALLATEYGPQLEPLRQRLSRDREQLGRMEAIYGPKHPLLLQQQAAVEHDRGALQSEGQNIATEIADRYAAALRREQLDRRLVDQQRTELEAFDQKAIRYRNLKTAADNSTHLYYELEQQIQDSNVASNLHGEGLRVINPARPNYRPVAPRTALVTLLAALLSTLLGLGGALLVGLLNKTVTTPEQVEHWFGLHVIGTLPLISGKSATALRLQGYGDMQLGRLLPSDGPAAGKDGGQSSFREMILALQSALLFAAPEAMTTLSISSAIPGEGKSTISAHLAAAIAGHGHTVVLVDADMRKPKLHRLFELPNRLGLSTVLSGACGLDDALVPSPHSRNLMILPAGPPPASPAELLQMCLGGLIEQLRPRARYVVIDCPPVLGFADAQAVASQVDAAVLVVHAGQTERDFVAGAVRQLRSVRSNLVGIVLNRVSSAVDSYYAYHSYYGKYYKDEVPEEGEE